MKQTIRFEKPYKIGPFRDAIDMIFPYTIVRSDLISAPEEQSSTLRYNLKIGISGTLSSCWDLQPDDLIKVLFEYGKRYIVELLKGNALSQDQELWLTTGNYPTVCPFYADRISSPSGAIVEVDTGDESLAFKVASSATAVAIIESRDNINALFHQKYKKKLIILREERDLLQFFQDCESAEEVSYRISSLRNAAVNLNVECLRELTGITDTKIQSIGLLEAYLNKIPGFDPQVVMPLKKLNKLRQGYPTHGDRSDGLLEALAYFEIQYPIEDHSSAWQILLKKYAETLRKIVVLVREDVFPGQNGA